MTTEDSRYQRAREKVRRLRGFYIHIAAYILVNLLLFAINEIATPEVLWFVWPLLGWGIGLGIHAAWVFGSVRVFGPEWEEKKIKEILESDQ